MSYLAIVAVILFVVGFATGPGSIPWFFVTELFAQSGRPTATSIAVTVNWSANFLVGLAFVPLQVRDRIKPVKRVLIFRCINFLADHGSLRLHHLHGHPAGVHYLRLLLCARDQEQDHRRHNCPVQEINQSQLWKPPVSHRDPCNTFNMSVLEHIFIRLMVVTSENKCYVD